jgi:hypothetical protein
MDQLKNKIIEVTKEKENALKEKTQILDEVCTSYTMSGEMILNYFWVIFGQKVFLINFGSFSHLLNYFCFCIFFLQKEILMKSVK